MEIIAIIIISLLALIGAVICDSSTECNKYISLDSDKISHYYCTGERCGSKCWSCKRHQDE